MIFVPVMRMARCASNECSNDIAHTLAQSLKLDPNTTLVATKAYVNASHTKCEQSHNDSMRLKLLVPPNLIPQWPSRALNLPRCLCEGELDIAKRKA